MQYNHTHKKVIVTQTKALKSNIKLFAEQGKNNVVELLKLCLLKVEDKTIAIDIKLLILNYVSACYPLFAKQKSDKATSKMNVAFMAMVA